MTDDKLAAALHGDTTADRIKRRTDELHRAMCGCDRISCGVLDAAHDAAIAERNTLDRVTQADNSRDAATVNRDQLAAADDPCGHVAFRTRLAIERRELPEPDALKLVEQLVHALEGSLRLADLLYDDVAKEVGVRIELQSTRSLLHDAVDHAAKAVEYGRENGVQL